MPAISLADPGCELGCPGQKPGWVAHLAACSQGFLRSFLGKTHVLWCFHVQGLRAALQDPAVGPFVRTRAASGFKPGVNSACIQMKAA